MTNLDKNSDLQTIRKENLLKLIKYINLTIPEFSLKVNKHKTYIYSLLKPLNEKKGLPISDKMARELENSINVKANLLDKINFCENDILSNDNISEIQIYPFSKYYKDGTILTKELEQNAPRISVSKTLITSNIYDSKTEFIRAKDDRMSPAIEKDSIVFLRQCTDWKSEISNTSEPNIYLVAFDNEFHLKRIRLVDINNANKICLFIDNIALYKYTSEILINTSDLGESFFIMAKVIGSLSL